MFCSQLPCRHPATLLLCIEPLSSKDNPNSGPLHSLLVSYGTPFTQIETSYCEALWNEDLSDTKEAASLLGLGEGAGQNQESVAFVGMGRP